MDNFALRFTKFDRETGQQIGAAYDDFNHGHPDVAAARKRLKQVNDFWQDNCFIDRGEIVVHVVEIVPVGAR